MTPEDKFVVAFTVFEVAVAFTAYDLWGQGWDEDTVKSYVFTCAMGIALLGPTVAQALWDRCSWLRWIFTKDTQ